MFHFCNCGSRLHSGVKRLHKRAKELRKVEIASGITLGETGTRNITISSGVIYEGINRLTPFTPNPFDSSESGYEFTYIYRDGTTAEGHTLVTGETQIDNTHYDDGDGTLDTLNPNKYGVHWVYIHPDDEHVYVVYGIGDYKYSEALASTPPTDVPKIISSFSVLIGRIIIKKNDATFTLIEQATSDPFELSAIEDHNDLANIQGGTTDEYYHITANEADKFREIEYDADYKAFLINYT